MRYRIVFILALLLACRAVAQQQYELDSDWRCAKAGSVPAKGDQISRIGYSLTGWLQATVPGTVLTSLLDNNLIPDPLYGMNNKQIPDIYDIGRDYYTYWFVKDFDEKATADDKVWLILRGVNYSCDIFLNGHKLNETPDKGMYLRHSYDITTCLSRDGHNRLAIIVYPPDPVGKPNGGQGGDGTISHSVTDQFTAGWDWIQPVHDRNTGIWDKVFIKKTKQVYVEHTHIVTSVPGRRMPEGQQKPATIKVTAEIENTSDTATIEGVAQYELDGRLVNVRMTLEPQTMQVVEFPPVQVDSPRLWWPNGSGPQDLYHIKVRFLVKGKAVSDEEQATFGIRELKYVWNTKTQSREIRCNGQRIFIKGGNRILSDELLRFSPERYDAEIRYHREMNLNLIRVWGGGITERPEFYDACDKYGLLVMQDLWVSGDCNGRWYDPLKAEDTFARRNYPDDHQLFTECVEDQIYMLRNHPSLAIWCGGNEITPPQDILTQIRDSLLPQLDGSRIFFPYSNDDSMSYQAHDGPYTIQRDTTFWAHRSWGFNSEVGSVGIGDVDALERFIPKKDLVPPHYDRAEHKWVVDSVWQYHKYSGYDSVMEQYGHPNDIGDFTRKAQLINYNQYRALIEGFTARMWEWYTGVIIWKTQNPWTAMVGQMYDTYLDPNACLYGTQEGAKPVHIMYDPVKNKVLIANNTLQKLNGLIVSYDVYQTSGTRTTSVDKAYNVSPHTVISCKPTFPMLTTGGFLQLHLYDSTGLADENTYWLPDKKGSYEWLAHIPAAHISTTMKEDSTGKLTVSVSCTDKAGLAFFLHITIVDKKTHKRILPVFCNNNYFSVVAGGSAQAVLEFEVPEDVTSQLCIEGWNVQKTFIDLKD